MTNAIRKFIPVLLAFFMVYAVFSLATATISGFRPIPQVSTPQVAQAQAPQGPRAVLTTDYERVKRIASAVQLEIIQMPHRPSMDTLDSYGYMHVDTSEKSVGDVSFACWRYGLDAATGLYAYECGPYNLGSKDAEGFGVNFLISDLTLHDLFDTDQARAVYIGR